MVYEEHRSAFKKTLFTLALASMASSCGGGLSPVTTSKSCAKPASAAVAGSEGTAYIFAPDPIVGSGKASLNPKNLDLDSYRSQVALTNLSGRGILEGRYVDVRNGLDCNEGHGAYSETNDFNFDHLESGFQEAMSYYYGDTYRSSLASAGSEHLLPEEPVRIVAHCERDDNAYYERVVDPLRGGVVERVCIGDSVATPGASYADDASVVVHELQHATTAHAYSSKYELNRFWYDEAGSLNEAVSDFLALAFLEPTVPSQFDPRLFSRWALGTFIPDLQGVRGAHKCPIYDSKYPECGDFPAFSSDRNTVSFVYPDGLGWPYANNFDGPAYVASAFTDFRAQEEIHNAGILLTGALWDIYVAVKRNHGEDAKLAFALTARATLKAVELLPKPTLLSQSPVTFRDLAESLIDVAPAVGFTGPDLSSAKSALEARGLYGGKPLPGGWATVGPGIEVSPGVEILDNPDQLKHWFIKMGASDPRIVTQSGPTSKDGKVEPGEIFAIWFDIGNSSDQTAGGLQITAIINDPDLEFLDGGYNIGAISTEMAQIRYAKVNGSAIVAALASSSSTFNAPAGVSYFRTNPKFDKSWATAIFMRSRPTAAPGKTVSLTLQVKPVNGSTETIAIPVTIH